MDARCGKYFRMESHSPHVSCTIVRHEMRRCDCVVCLLNRSVRIAFVCMSWVCSDCYLLAKRVSWSRCERRSIEPKRTITIRNSWVWNRREEKYRYHSNGQHTRMLAKKSCSTSSNAGSRIHLSCLIQILLRLAWPNSAMLHSFQRRKWTLTVRHRPY